MDFMDDFDIFKLFPSKKLAFKVLNKFNYYNILLILIKFLRWFNKILDISRKPNNAATYRIRSMDCI